MKSYHLHTGDVDALASLVVRYHYSRRPPSNIQLAVTAHAEGGLFGDRGKPIAACAFSIPPTRWSYPVWELSRLVKIPDSECQLSWFVSKAVGLINKSECDLVVSFADSTVGHHGGIYQACSWNFHGKRKERMDGVLINGVFVPGRSCNSIYGTQSPRLLAERGISAEPHFDKGKFLYWKALSKSGMRKAAALGLQAIPYPKPAKQSQQQTSL